MTAGLDGARLAVLVHEVRSPVAALAAVSETVAEQPRDAAMRRELVRLALAACRAIERIVLDLAVASVRFEAVDVADLVRDAVAAFTVRGADVAATEGPFGNLVVDGDPIRLRQAVDNLIANALIHGGRGGTVTVRATARERAVEVAVSDTGPGIPAEALARIFDAGVRLDEARAGSGLGLALARAVVDAHGGALEVDSTPGAGSTFSIVLPAHSTQAAT